VVMGPKPAPPPPVQGPDANNAFDDWGEGEELRAELMRRAPLANAQPMRKRICASSDRALPSGIVTNSAADLGDHMSTRLRTRHITSSLASRTPKQPGSASTGCRELGDRRSPEQSKPHWIQRRFRRQSVACPDPQAALPPVVNNSLFTILPRSPGLCNRFIQLGSAGGPLSCASSSPARKPVAELEGTVAHNSTPPGCCCRLRPFAAAALAARR